LSGFRAVGRWAARSLGVEGFADEAIRLFNEGRRGTTLGDALIAVGGEATPDVVASMVDVYRRHRPDIRLLDDAAQLISAVRGSSPVAVITDGPAASQRAKVEALGVPGFADPILVTEELGDGYA